MSKVCRCVLVSGGVFSGLIPSAALTAVLPSCCLPVPLSVKINGEWTLAVSHVKTSNSGSSCCPWNSAHMLCWWFCSQKFSFFTGIFTPWAAIWLVNMLVLTFLSWLEVTVWYPLGLCDITIYSSLHNTALPQYPVTFAQIILYYQTCQPLRVLHRRATIYPQSTLVWLITQKYTKRALIHLLIQWLMSQSVYWCRIMLRRCFPLISMHLKTFFCSTWS